VAKQVYNGHLDLLHAVKNKNPDRFGFLFLYYFYKKPIRKLYLKCTTGEVKGKAVLLTPLTGLPSKLVRRQK
jgi:hypothetical protein